MTLSPYARKVQESVHLGKRRFRLVITPYFLLFALAFVHAPKALPQTDATRVYGPEDSSVPTPALRVALGQQDAGALQEIIDYVKAVNLTNWQGLRATGAINNFLAGGTSDPSTLTLSGSDKVRLDVTSPAGTHSTRIIGTFGKIKDFDGHVWVIPQATARLGLLFYPRLLSASFPTKQTTLLDGGQIEISGEKLHRITIADFVADDQHPDTPPDRMQVVDLYFDASTHLLMKSAAQIQVSSDDRARYVQVATYGDYRSVGEGMLAFQVHQSLNGQPQWTLQLATADLASDTNDSDFNF